MTILFNTFIDDLNISNEKKEKIKNDIKTIGCAKSGICNLLMQEDYQ